MLMMSLMMAAQQACAVPPALAGFARPVAARAGAVLEPGRAMRVPLTRDARLTVAPGKVPAPGTHGGTFTLKVARAGRYRIALDAAVWIEVAHGGAHRLTSVAHGHAPPCSGARKLVDFDLAPGTYLVQLSGAAAPAATVLVARL